MLDVRPALHLIGLLLVALAAFMVAPALFDLSRGHRDWLVFATSSAVTLFAGLALMASQRERGRLRLTVRHAFLLTAGGWLSVAVFASLPFAFAELSLSPADAFFEAMSGITTTGSTVIRDLDRAPPGLLLWRGLLQWVGGIGIIIMAIAVLPLLKIGGMQMFRLESSETMDKAMPRLAKMAGGIALLYLGLTVVLFAFFLLAGMGRFDAAVHAMTTISTGGFSNHDASIGHFQNTGVTLVATFGMIVGGLPFALMLTLVRGPAKLFWRDQQVRWYLSLLALGSLGTTSWLWLSLGASAGDALLHGAFTVVSFMTGTGFHTLDFGYWNGLPVAILFFLTFVGGCAGSTSAGIKVFRFQILFETARAQIAQLLQPNSISLPTYNGKTIPETAADSVMGFLFVFTLSFAILSMALAMLGLDFLTAISGAASALSNVGPGLGNVIGPASTYAGLPDSAKILLSFGMLFGRLEMFVILVLFVPHFWRP